MVTRVASSTRGAGIYSPGVPMPAFISLFAANDFFGMTCVAPTAGGIPTDSESAINLVYTVSGASGSQTLTISAGTEANGTGIWSAVLQHDNGTYGLYGVSALGAGVCTVTPALRATVTNGSLRNLGEAVNGQHLTDPGYRALARYIYAQTKQRTYRSRYAARWLARQGLIGDWTRTGGMSAGQANLAVAGNALPSGTGGRPLIAVGRWVANCTPTAPYTGKGFSKSFSVGGRTGYLETHICASVATTGPCVPVNVTVTADGVTVFNVTYGPNDYLQRVIAPYVNASTVVLTVSRSDETALAGSITIGDVFCWVYDRPTTPSDRVILPNDRVVVIGDSWTTRYSSLLASEIQTAMTQDGGRGTCVSVGLASQKASWGLANFDSLVAPLSPTVVVFNFSINDCNAVFRADEFWIAQMHAIAAKAQALGATPVILLPPATASDGQCLSLGRWAELIWKGTSI